MATRELGARLALPLRVSPFAPSSRGAAESLSSSDSSVSAASASAATKIQATRTSSLPVLVACPTNLVYRGPQARNQRGVLVNPSGGSQALDRPTCEKRLLPVSLCSVHRVQAQGCADEALARTAAAPSRRRCFLPRTCSAKLAGPVRVIAHRRHAANTAMLGMEGGEVPGGGEGRAESSHGKSVRAMVGKRVGRRRRPGAVFGMRR